MSMVKVVELTELAKATAKQATSYARGRTRETVAFTKLKTSEAATFATTTRTGVTGSAAAASAVLGTAAGGVVGTAAGAVSGGAVGVVAGAALGVIPAFFTFGASIPVFATIGLCAGATTGGTVGAVGGATAGSAAGGAGGATVGFVGFTYRKEINDKAQATRVKVRTATAHAKTTVCDSAAHVAHFGKTLVERSTERVQAALGFTKAKIAESVSLTKAKARQVSSYTHEQSLNTVALSKDIAQNVWTKMHTSATDVTTTAYDSIARASHSMRVVTDYSVARARTALVVTKAMVLETVGLAQSKAQETASFTQEFASKTLAFTKKTTQGATDSVKHRLRSGSTGTTR